MLRENVLAICGMQCLLQKSPTEPVSIFGPLHNDRKETST